MARGARKKPNAFRCPSTHRPPSVRARPRLRTAFRSPNGFGGRCAAHGSRKARRCLRLRPRSARSRKNLSLGGAGGPRQGCPARNRAFFLAGVYQRSRSPAPVDHPPASARAHPVRESAESGKSVARPPSCARGASPQRALASPVKLASRTAARLEATEGPAEALRRARASFRRRRAPRRPRGASRRNRRAATRGAPTFAAPGARG